MVVLYEVQGPDVGAVKRERGQVCNKRSAGPNVRGVSFHVGIDGSASLRQIDDLSVTEMSALRREFYTDRV